MIDLQSPKTLRKHFRQELSTGMAEANAAVIAKGYELANSGRCLAMTIFFSKCLLEPLEFAEDEEAQKDHTVELRFLDKDGVPTREPGVIDGKN